MIVPNDRLLGKIQCQAGEKIFKVGTTLRDYLTSDGCVSVGGVNCLS